MAARFARSLAIYLSVVGMSARKTAQVVSRQVLAEAHHARRPGCPFFDGSLSRQAWTHRYHSRVHSHPFVRSCIHSFIQALQCLRKEQFTLQFTPKIHQKEPIWMNSLVHWFLVHPFVHSIIHSCVRLCIHPFIHPSVHPFIHSMIHSFIHFTISGIYQSTHSSIH